jgi:hypothetical protein
MGKSTAPGSVRISAGASRCVVQGRDTSEAAAARIDLQSASGAGGTADDKK